MANLHLKDIPVPIMKRIKNSAGYIQSHNLSEDEITIELCGLLLFSINNIKESEKQASKIPHNLNALVGS